MVRVEYLEDLSNVVRGEHLVHIDGGRVELMEVSTAISIHIDLREDCFPIGEFVGEWLVLHFIIFPFVNHVRLKFIECDAPIRIDVHAIEEILDLGLLIAHVLVHPEANSK